MKPFVLILSFTLLHIFNILLYFVVSSSQKLDKSYIFVCVVQNLTFCGMLSAKRFSEKLRNCFRHEELSVISPICVCVTRGVIDLRGDNTGNDSKQVALILSLILF